MVGGGGALRVGLRNAPGIVLASLGPTGTLLGPTQPLSERDATPTGPWIVPTTTGRHVFWQEHASTSGGPMRFLGLPLDNAAMALGAPREFPVMGLPSAIVWEGSAFVFAVPAGRSTGSSGWAPAASASPRAVSRMSDVCSRRRCRCRVTPSRC